MVAVSEMAEAKLQGMIYYIKKFKRIGHTSTHADFELSKVHTMCHQRDMEESHNDPEMVPTVNPRDWPKTLKTLEYYIRLFRGVDGQPLSYGLRVYLITSVAKMIPRTMIMEASTSHMMRR